MEVVTNNEVIAENLTSEKDNSPSNKPQSIASKYSQSRKKLSENRLSILDREVMGRRFVDAKDYTSEGHSDVNELNELYDS